MPDSDAVQNWSERTERWLAVLRSPGAGPAAADATVGAAVCAALRAAWAKQSGDLAAAKAAVLRESGSLDDLRGKLLRMAERIERDLRLTAQQERFGRRWQEERGAALRASFASNPAAAMLAWQSDFSEALAAWQLDTCDWLIESTFPGIDENIRGRYARGLNALRTRPDADVLAWLDTLTARKAPPHDVAATETRRLLLVLKARVQMHDLGDTEDAEATLELASDRMHQPSMALADAAWGELFRTTNRPSEAQAAFEKAVIAAPELPDAYVGCGAVAGDAERWEDADVWFDKAIALALDETNPLMALQRLRAPCPARLLLRFGEVIKARNPACAWQAIDMAIAARGADVAGKKMASALEQRADRRSEGGDAAGAARDLVDAAMELIDTTPEAASALYQRAIALAPDNAVTYWSAADACYLASYLPDPPYAKPDVLAQALALWNQGVARGLPTGSDGWAYLTRAVIAERETGLRPSERESLLWQAVQWTECALLFLPHHGYGWSTLGRLHRGLGNEQSAFEASARSVELMRNDLITLEERLISVVNLDLFEQAKELLPKWRKLRGNQAWIDAIEAHVILRTPGDKSAEDLRRALDLAVRSVDQKWPWATHVRATLYLLLGDPNAAMREWDRMLETMVAPASDNRDEFALACIMRSRYSQALEIVQAMALEPSGRGAAKLLAGLVHLKRGAAGDLETAGSLAREGFRLATRSALRYWLYQFAPDLRPVLAGDGAASAEQRELLEQLLREGKAELDDKPIHKTAIAEIQALLDSDPVLFAPGSDMRRGALATLGRSLRAEQRFTEALACYRELRPDSKTQPWQQGVEITLAACLDRAQWPDDPKDAANAARKLIQFLDENGLRSALWCAQLHMFLVVDSDTPQSTQFDHLIIAADLAAAAYGPKRAGPNLVDGIADRLAEPPTIWNLDRQLARLEQSDSETRRTLARAARAMLIESFDNRLSQESMIGGGARDYVAEPLSLYLGRGFEIAEGRDSVSDAWSEIQKRTLENLGVELPDMDIHDVSGATNLDHTCVVELNGVPIWLAPEPSDQLTPFIERIDAVVRVQMGELFSIQDAYRWLQRPDSSSPKLVELCRQLSADPADLHLLTQILRALIVESVSIANVELIVNTFMLARDEDFDVLLQRIRFALRDVLPGNSESTRKVRLPPAVENDLLAWHLVERGRGFLTMPPEEAQELLQDVGSLLRDGEADQALVVAKAGLRAPLRRVTVLDYPRLPVLAGDEVAPAAPDTGEATLASTGSA